MSSYGKSGVKKFFNKKAVMFGLGALSFAAGMAIPGVGNAVVKGVASVRDFVVGKR